MSDVQFIATLRRFIDSAAPGQLVNVLRSLYIVCTRSPLDNEEEDDGVTAAKHAAAIARKTAVFMSVAPLLTFDALCRLNAPITLPDDGANNNSPVVLSDFGRVFLTRATAAAMVNSEKPTAELYDIFDAETETDEGQSFAAAIQRVFDALPIPFQEALEREAVAPHLRGVAALTIAICWAPTRLFVLVDPISMAALASIPLDAASVAAMWRVALAANEAASDGEEGTAASAAVLKNFVPSPLLFALASTYASAEDGSESVTADDLEFLRNICRKKSAHFRLFAGLYGGKDAPAVLQQLIALAPYRLPLALRFRDALSAPWSATVSRRFVPALTASGCDVHLRVTLSPLVLGVAATSFSQRVHPSAAWAGRWTTEAHFSLAASSDNSIVNDTNTPFEALQWTLSGHTGVSYHNYEDGSISMSCEVPLSGSIDAGKEEAPFVLPVVVPSEEDDLSYATIAQEVTTTSAERKAARACVRQVEKQEDRVSEQISDACGAQRGEEAMKPLRRRLPVTQALFDFTQASRPGAMMSMLAAPSRPSDE